MTAGKSRLIEAGDHLEAVRVGARELARIAGNPPRYNWEWDYWTAVTAHAAEQYLQVVPDASREFHDAAKPLIARSTYVVGMAPMYGYPDGWPARFDPHQSDSDLLQLAIGVETANFGSLPDVSPIAPRQVRLTPFDPMQAVDAMHEIKRRALKIEEGLAMTSGDPEVTHANTGLMLIQMGALSEALRRGPVDFTAYWTDVPFKNVEALAKFRLGSPYDELVTTDVLRQHLADTVFYVESALVIAGINRPEANYLKLQRERELLKYQECRRSELDSEVERLEQLSQQTNPADQQPTAPLPSATLGERVRTLLRMKPTSAAVETSPQDTVVTHAEISIALGRAIEKRDTFLTAVAEDTGSAAYVDDLRARAELTAKVVEFTNTLPAVEMHSTSLPSPGNGGSLSFGF